MENYFYVEGKTSYLAFISIGKIILIILLALFLVPQFSLIGLAWSQLLASIVALAVVSYLVAR